MAKISVSSVKGLFQTGDRPTQENYVDLIDTLVSQSTDLGSAGNNENTINGIENVTVIDNFDATGPWVIGESDAYLCTIEAGYYYFQHKIENFL